MKLLLCFLFAGLAVSVLSPTASTRAVDVTSEPGLSPQSGALGYAKRGNRCEGLLLQPLSDELELSIVSFAYYDESVTSGDSLRVDLIAPVDRSLAVQIIAEPFDGAVPYRMDAV